MRNTRNLKNSVSDTLNVSDSFAFMRNAICWIFFLSSRKSWQKWKINDYQDLRNCGSTGLPRTGAYRPFALSLSKSASFCVSASERSFLSVLRSVKSRCDIPALVHVEGSPVFEKHLFVIAYKWWSLNFFDVAPRRKDAKNVWTTAFASWRLGVLARKIQKIIFN